MDTSNDFQATKPADELEEILKSLPGVVPAQRSFLNAYADFIGAALERRLPLSYEQLATVLNSKFAKDGKLNAAGGPLTVTRQGVNAFVLRRKAQVAKRSVAADAVKGFVPEVVLVERRKPAVVHVAEMQVAEIKVAPLASASEKSDHVETRPSGTHKRSSFLGASKAGGTAIDKLIEANADELPGFVSGAKRLLS